MISIVVPAHNEARVIERCLRHMTDGADPAEVEIIVVCNACEDKTADIARAFPFPVIVLESPVPSKPNALNLGDKEARGYPRFYIDADVVVDWSAVQEVARALESGPALVAAPRLQLDLEGTSWAVRAFYRVWTEHSYFREGLIGSGFYAFSAEGRSRFELFPETHAEDEFIRVLFAIRERASVDSCAFVVFPPRRLADLVRIRARRRIGSLQVLRLVPERVRADRASYAGAVLRLLAKPRLWPALPIYYTVVILGRVLGALRFRRGQLRWDQDVSSRSGCT